jgi:hypothetical protein
VLGQHLREVGLDAQFAGHPARYFLAVAGEHCDGDALLSQRRDRLGRLGADDVGQREGCPHGLALQQVDDRLAARGPGLALARQIERRGRIRFLQQPRPADLILLPVDRRLRAAPGQRQKVLRRRQAQAALPRRCDQRPSDRVLAIGLDRGR